MRPILREPVIIFVIFLLYVLVFALAVVVGSF